MQISYIREAKADGKVWVFSIAPTTFGRMPIKDYVATTYSDEEADELITRLIVIDEKAGGGVSHVGSG